MNNREKLLECALELFAARGYDAVGVQEIAEAAGVQKPTLYHYFSSKIGLLKALLNENFEPFFEILQSAAQYRGDVASTLSQTAGAYFSFARRRPALYRFYLSLWFAAPDSDASRVSRALNDRQQILLEALFAGAARDHSNMRGRQRTYAASFMGLINTYAMLALNGYTALDDNTVQGAVQQFMHGIFS